MKNKKKKKGINYTSMKCPYCGATVVYRSADGIYKNNHKNMMLYVCSNYPECDFISWNKPTGDICDKCQSYMIEKATKSQTKVVCPNKECKNEIIKEDTEN